MAKRVIWTDTAKKARRSILECWISRNSSSIYSRRLPKLFRIKISLLQSEKYLGKPTDFKDIRVSLVIHFSIFCRVTDSEIVNVGIWDNCRNPDDLRRKLEI